MPPREAAGAPDKVAAVEALLLGEGGEDAEPLGDWEPVPCAVDMPVWEGEGCPEGVAPGDSVGAGVWDGTPEACALGVHEADALSDPEGGGVALSLGSADKDAEGREEALSLSKDENEAVGSDDRETVG